MPPNNPDACDDIQPNSSKPAEEIQRENKTVTQKGASKLNFSEPGEKLLTENKTVSQDPVMNPKSSKVPLKSAAEYNTVTQDAVKMPKSPRVPKKNATEYSTVTQDAVKKPKSTRVPKKSAADYCTVTQDAVKMPKSPRVPKKSAAEYNTVSQDTVKKPKSPRVPKKITAEYNTVSHEAANMPKSPRVPKKSATEYNTVNQDAVRKPKSPKVPVKSAAEYNTVTQDTVKQPKSPRVPKRNAAKYNTATQDVVMKSKSPKLPVKSAAEYNIVTQDAVNTPKSPRVPKKIASEYNTVTQDAVNIPKSPRVPKKVVSEYNTVTQDAVNIPKSPKVPKKIASEYNTVTQDAVNIPKSPRVPKKTAADYNTVTQDAVKMPKSPRVPKKSAAVYDTVTQDEANEPRFLNSKPLPERKSVTPDGSTKKPTETVHREQEVNQDPWTLKKIVSTFATGTSNHGFANSHHLWSAGYRWCSLALLTTALFLAAIGFLFGFIGVRDMLQPDYFSTQIKMINDKQNGLALPRIIMSNSGLFNYSALEEHKVSLYEVSLITTLLLGEVAHTTTLENNIEQVNKDYHTLLTRLNTTAWGVWHLLSYKCDEVIIDCLFNTKHIPGPVCCEEHFDTVLSNFGLSFISRTTFVQEREEVAAGLTLSLRVPLQPLELDWDYMNSDAILLKSGMRVSVVESSKDFSLGFSSTTPVFGLDRILVTLAYEQHDNTGMYQSLFPWLDATADCTPDDAPFREQAAVGDHCMASSLHVCGQQLRNCNVVSYPFWNGKDRFCDFKDQLALIQSKAAAECRSDQVDNCGNLCQENIYRFSVQSCPLMEFTESLDKRNNSKGSVEGAFTMFYTHLGHTLVTKSRANLVNILSSLGGTMGLFMGASILNLGEQTTVVSGIIIWIGATIRRRLYRNRNTKVL